MTPGPAATWIAPADETDRGNLLGAASVAAQREARELALLRQARAEGWRLLLLALGADSTSQSGDLAELLLTRLAAMPGRLRRGRFRRQRFATAFPLAARTPSGARA